MDWARRSYCRQQKMLRYYTIALIALSLSVFLMPIVNGIKTSTKIPIYMDGALFWIAFISTVRMVVKINRSRRRSPSFNERYGELKKLGLIHFFQNKEAVIMDAMMFVSLIAFIVVRFLRWSTTVCFLFVSMFLFSFGMHCMLNGINYIYIKHKTNVRRD